MYLQEKAVTRKQIEDLVFMQIELKAELSVLTRNITQLDKLLREKIPKKQREKFENQRKELSEAVIQIKSTLVTSSLIIKDLKLQVSPRSHLFV